MGKILPKRLGPILKLEECVSNIAKEPLASAILPIREAFADPQSLVTARGSRGGRSKSGGDNGGNAGQYPNPLQPFCHSSISLCLET